MSSDLTIVLDTNVLLVALPTRSPYRPKLITSDPDDDKFSDAAIAANAAYLVTNDRHFDVLRTIGFPQVRTCTAQQFLQIVIGNNGG